MALLLRAAALQTLLAQGARRGIEHWKESRQKPPGNQGDLSHALPTLFWLLVEQSSISNSYSTWQAWGTGSETSRTLVHAPQPRISPLTSVQT